ncbi:uncharacterized protein [Nicotiana tomentosiformis]|uniref:uncharacterized protein n=1 Tax=Nicotiana tomentosiformis TaxID=4098 RepID=UPI00388CEA7A
MAVLDQEDTPVGDTSFAAATSTRIDRSDPLYLHPLDNHRAMLVSVPFSEIGYRSWRRSVMQDIADIVEYANNVIELWRELEDRYVQTNGARLYQIQKEINDLSQGVLDITSYYTKLKKLWEELNTLSKKTHCICTCTCGAKENMHKAEQDKRLIQFLMGLNEVYTIVRGSILMMNPLPTLAQAFSLLI